MNKNVKEAILLSEPTHSKNVNTNCILKSYAISNVGNAKDTMELIATQNHLTTI